MARVILELVRVNRSEDCSEIIEDAPRIMKEAEKQGDEEMKLFAQGVLDMLKHSRKVWRFLWSPRVETEWHFDDPRIAKKLCRGYRKFGVKTS